MEKLILAAHKGLYITILYFLFACSPAPSVVATSRPSATATLIPTLTNTPAPILTVQPSATPSPTATLTPLVEDLGQVIFSESFDDMDFPFYICGTGHIESGMLVVERGPEEISPCGMFSGGIYGIDPIPPDTTVIVLFKTTSDFNIGVHTGDYRDETLRRFTFGTTQGIATWDVGTGSNLKTRLTQALKVDSWYYFSIKRSINGDMHAKLWQPDKPKNVIEFDESLGSEWGTLPLTFVSDFKDVPFFVDEYQVLK